MTEFHLHNRLGFRVSRLAQIMQSRLEALLVPLGLTRLSWCVLTGVEDERITTPSDLAAYIGITRPTMSRLLRGLEARGLITRKAGQDDGRGVVLELTPQGRTAHQAARAHVEAEGAHFAAKLTPAQHAVFMQTIAFLDAGETQSLSGF
ncbi:MAG: MarR family transcriptional regulator [Pseudorhodobacter sp.]